VKFHVITKSSLQTLSSVAHTSKKGIKTCLKWSLARGWKQLENSKYIIHKSGHGWEWEVVAYKRWSHIEVWLYLLFFNLSTKAWTPLLLTARPPNISPFHNRIFPHSSCNGWGVFMPLKWSTVLTKAKQIVPFSFSKETSFLPRWSGPLLSRWGRMEPEITF